MNYTYLLRCADGSLYCGWTNHLTERLHAHNTGKGAKYTKGRGPLSLVWYESFATKEEAMKREAALKKLTKGQKEELVCGFIDRRDPEADVSLEAAAKKREVFPAPAPMPLRIIISPAKKMQAKSDYLPHGQLPEFIEEAGSLLSCLKNLKESGLKDLFRANESITHENYLRFRTMRLNQNLTAAVLAYVGIQYQYMAPHIFSKEQWDYVCRHLRILSGFYGVLRADDGVVPYRLEMQALLRTEKAKNLYEFWGNKLYRAIAEAEQAEGKEMASPKRVSGCRILNLASKEYSKAVEPYLCPGDTFVTCIFGTQVDGKIKVKATEAKMARGEMVRFLAETGTEDFEGVKAFNRLGFCFCPERSTENEYVFIKGKEHD